MPISIEDLAVQAADLCKIASANPEDARHELWDYSVARADELRPHFVYDAKPEDTLKRHRPKEDSEITQYRLESHENITYSFTRRVLNYLQRIFNPALFSLSFPDIDRELPGVDASNSLRSYLTSQLPAYGSLVSFLRDFGMEKMFSDPNGYIVIFTDLSDTELFEQEGPQALQKPYPKFVGSEHAFQCGHDSLVVLSSQKSAVKINKDSAETVDEGYVYFVFTPDITFRVVQYGVQSELRFESQIWNFHESGFPMFTHLGGKPTPHNEKVLTPNSQVAYDSHLQPAIPYLNKLVSLDSEQTASYLMHIFIQRWEEAIPCPSCKGKGQLSIVDSLTPDGKPRTCDSCKGTGAANAGTTFKRMYVQRDAETGKIDPTPPFGFEAPPVDIVKVVEDKLRLLARQALEALNMGFLDKKETTHVESAESKRQEKDALNTMLETVRKDIDRLGNFIAKAANVIRYPALGERLEENMPSISAPTSFDLETPLDSMAYIEGLKKGCAPAYYIKEVLKQNASQRFGMGSDKEARVHIAIDLDPFLAMSAEDIADLEQAGANIRKIDLAIHTYMPELLRIAMEQNDGFIELSIEEQREIVEELATAYLPEETPAIEVAGE